MNGTPRVNVWKRLRGSLLAAFLVWGGWSGWALWRVHQAGEAMVSQLPPADSQDELARRTAYERVRLSAAKLSEGQFASAAASLKPPAVLSAEDRAAVERFFTGQPALRQRLLVDSSMAQQAEQNGGEAAGMRDALRRVLAAAARNDAAGVATELAIAEALSESPLGAALPASGTAAQAVERLLAVYGPGFELGRELELEGYRPVEMLLDCARRMVRDGQERQAAQLIDLAARLLRLDPVAVEPSGMPQWFLSLAGRPPASVPAERSQAAMALCEAMTSAEAPSPPVKEAVAYARRAAKTQKLDEAYWWSALALRALGVPDDEIATLGVADGQSGDWSIFRREDAFFQKTVTENMDLSPSLAPKGDSPIFLGEQVDAHSGASFAAKNWDSPHEGDEPQ